MSSGYFKLLPNGDKEEIPILDAEPYIMGTKRHRMLHGVKVIFTDAEERERDAEEAQWLADAPKRKLAQIEQHSGMDRGEREIAIKVLPPESARRKKAEKAEAEIIALGIRA